MGVTDHEYHQPVLLPEVLAAAHGALRVLDATLGGGGHAGALRGQGAVVLGIDRDPTAVEVARRRLGSEGMQYLQAAYDTVEVLEAAAAFRPDFILLDLGVSSHQLDDDRRGFSFRPGALLDMRMSGRGRTAAELLASADAVELRRIFREYGDERKAGRLAREVVRRRSSAPFQTSDDLVNAIRAVLGPRSGPGDFARLFQAVRMAVNRELEGLEGALPALRDTLARGGRLAVISYHSGEDRVVKRQFHEWARACICPPESPVCTCRGRPLGRMEPRKPIRPSAMEIASNPRSRSAKLRIFRLADDT
jgi:16S rRNA (cytosine1402-N4)-methyltransferase